MDLRELKAFCSVAEGGGFSRAAAALGVAQSVLSRQVSALESELGGRLFHRTGRGTQPTELGLALLPRARGLLADAEQLVAEASGMRGSPVGSVDLGVVPGWAQPLISTLCSRLMRDYPRVRLRVHEAYSGQVEEWVASGRVEVAIFNRYRRGAVRGAERVMRGDMMLVGPRDHPALRRKEVPFRALAGVPLAAPVWPNGLTSVMRETAARQGIALDFVMEGSSSALLREAVARSGLCTVFPKGFAEREMAGPQFAAARIVKPTIEQTTWLAVGTHRPASLAVRTVARLVREILKAG
ncbi:MAG: LysR family transcriptional regulator [Reyranella sp.]|nr:LysR family transcriptional regulator [Reyranella sp.]